MRHDGGDTSTASQSDITKLKNDVLKQASASLAAFIGEIRYSDTYHISAAGAAAVVPCHTLLDEAGLRVACRLVFLWTEPQWHTVPYSMAKEWRVQLSRQT